jgi:arsenite methyltransferase
VNLPRLSLLPTFLREIFSTRVHPREPEPDLVMDDPEAVRAFTHAGRPGGPAEAYYLFYCGRACVALHGARRVLDLGCGPGTQLVQLAELCPDVAFTGVDLSESMLAEARRYAAERGVRNVDFVRGDATRLEFPDHSFDGVMSVMALHHMPTDKELRAVFREIARVRTPGGAVFLVDFGRLKSPFSMLTFAFDKADAQSPLLTLDYERSLRAAFRLEDYRAIAGECLPETTVHSTFKVPMLVVIQTPDRPLPGPLRERLRDKVENLPRDQRRDMDDLRVFLQLGGLDHDPFGGAPAWPLEVYRQWARQRSTGPATRGPRTGLGRWGVAAEVALRIAAHGLRAKFWSWASARVAEHRAEAERKDTAALSRFLQKRLGALKGPLMKFGQMASYLNDRWPPEARAFLASLQDHAPAMNARAIRAHAELSLGNSLEALFTDWEDAPLAAASIAQIHIARRKTGERVVVKVKYPGIESAVRSDLRLLRVLSPWVDRRLRVVSNTRSLLKETSALLAAECDFAKEAENQTLFREAFRDDPALVIPRVHADASSRDVLTMDYIEGRSFVDFRDAASAEEKNRAALAIARFAVTAIHRHAIYNGDPHPGNYLFLADGRVACLDFGFSRRWPAAFINASKRQALAAHDRDLETFTAMARLMGYEFDRTEDYREFLELLRSGPYAPWIEDRDFHYTRSFLHNEMGKVADFSRRAGRLRLSPEHLIVQRVMWGHHALFADLDARFNLHRVLLPLLRATLPDDPKNS